MHVWAAHLDFSPTLIQQQHLFICWCWLYWFELLAKCYLTSILTQGQDAAASCKEWNSAAPTPTQLNTWWSMHHQLRCAVCTWLTITTTPPRWKRQNLLSVCVCRFQTMRQNASHRSRQSSQTASSRCRRERTEASSSTSWLSSTCFWLWPSSATITSCRPWKWSANVSVTQNFLLLGFEEWAWCSGRTCAFIVLDSVGVSFRCSRTLNNMDG